ncbi:MAG: type II toxin-antitoxin system VapC family toxin [Magnetococcales bacterium]|nr:type II toxin-antitoxin system VapC family toxin [Magnetococcales bacterium]
MNGVDWLLDSNVVIGLLKGNAEAVSLAEFQKLVLSRCAVSQITRMELLGFPGLTESEEQRILAFLNDCRVVLLDEAIERQAIRLRRTGLFKLPDAIIAATAILWKLKLVTLDHGMHRGFEQVNTERAAP